MKFQFTGGDAVTFLIGLVVALAFVFGEALIETEALFDNSAMWLRAVGVGVGTSTGRYLITYMAQRGFSKGA